MPETFIIYREKYKHTLAEEWRRKFHALRDSDLSAAKMIIEGNNFADVESFAGLGQALREVLSYYTLERE